jgi:3-isopropylmalate dehydrogenase
MAADAIDYVILRENCEGLYLSRGVGITTPQAATDTLMVTERGCTRISRLAFELARNKERGAPADGKKRVTLVDKSNVLRSFAFFRRLFLEIAAEFPDVEAECLHMDAAAAALVNRPGHFQIIVTENMFGDILTDEASVLAGSIGMLPSASLAASGPGLYEPIHGSAPDIAGRGIANPCGTILSAAMLLRHSLALEAEARAVEQAVQDALDRGIGTVDVVGRERARPTREVAAAIAAAVGAGPTRRAIA